MGTLVALLAFVLATGIGVGVAFGCAGAILFHDAIAARATARQLAREARLEDEAALRAALRSPAALRAPRPPPVPKVPLSGARTLVARPVSGGARRL